FSSRRRHTRSKRDWSSDVCSSDLFTEDRLEQAIIELLAAEGYPHTVGEALDRNPDDVLIKSDLRQFLATRYKDDLITEYEIESKIGRASCRERVESMEDE